MKKTFFLIILISSILLPQSTKDHTKYFPLAVGNEWEYVTEIDGKTPLTVHWAVKDIKNNDFVLIENLYIENFKPITNEFRYAIRNSMIMITGVGGGFLNERYKPYNWGAIEFVLPLKVGSEWEYKTDQGQTVKKKVVQWHKSISTKYGKFNDVFEIYDGLTDHYFYYAYGIGLIKDESINPKTGVRSVVGILKSYTIK